MYFKNFKNPQISIEDSHINPKTGEKCFTIDYHFNDCTIAFPVFEEWYRATEKSGKLTSRNKVMLVAPRGHYDNGQPYYPEVFGMRCYAFDKRREHADRNTETKPVYIHD